MVQVKLDAVVKVKARAEERLLEAFAEAQRGTLAAKEALRQAEARADASMQGGGIAADFSMYEAARGRALEAVKRARAGVDAALQHEEKARAAWVTARAQVDAVRRVADARRDEITKEAETKEQKRADDLTLLRFARAG
jgi:flagellar export protein FliJ